MRCKFFSDLVNDNAKICNQVTQNIENHELQDVVLPLVTSF